MRIPLSRIGWLVTVLWVAAITGPGAQQLPLTSTALTPLPRLIWFSGVFRPADQLPVAPVEAVTVAVYRDRDGGDALWQETQHVPMNGDGRYNLLLGATVPDGLPLALFTSGETRWIGITVHRSGEMEQPRVHLASVPYALKAADADTLGGQPASAYLRAESAPVTPEAGAPASKTSSTMALPNTAGTVGYLGMFVDSENLGNSALFQSGSSIGLGTVPADAFHVAFTNVNGTKTGYAVRNLSGAADAYSGMLFYDQNGSLGQFQGFNNATHEYRINNIATGGSINFMIGHNSKFLVANNGNIGIGNPVPQSKLDVAGDMRLGGYLMDSGGIPVLRANFNGGNAALGYRVLFSNVSGVNNTAVGWQALGSTTASANTAVGYGALYFNTTGTNNIAIGQNAGLNIAAANSNNIAIGSLGNFGDSGTIRIGTSGNQTSFFAAGVRGVTTGQNDAVPVVIDSTGQLGTMSSSRRFKENIQDMGEASRGLMQLRPVTFRYKTPFADGSKPIQYGLIAEEVAEVYPDLVARSGDGQIETVKYQVVEVLLLNEVQQQQADIRAQQTEIRALVEQNRDLQQRLAALEAALAGRR